MSRPKPKPIDELEKLWKLKEAGMLGSSSPNRDVDDFGVPVVSVDECAGRILDIVERKGKEDGKVLFFVMYDIESNKVRRYVVKYLEKQGCIRVQKSIFLANLDVAVCEEIKRDLAEVQSLYDNHDSILVVPISSDYLRAMKIIGQNIDIDIITRSKSTLFF